MINKSLVIPYFDTVQEQFQIKENGTPKDITGQTLILYIKKKNDETFTPIEKDIDDEGWFDDAANGIFHIVIDTETYLMQPGNYQAEIEWVDQKTSLVFFEIRIIQDIRH